MVGTIKLCPPYMAPTLVLVGENQKLYRATAAVQRLSVIVPHIQTEIVQGAGHDLFMMQADHVNHRLLDFLRTSEEAL